MKYLLVSPALREEKLTALKRYDAGSALEMLINSFSSTITWSFSPDFIIVTAIRLNNLLLENPGAFSHLVSLE